MVIISDLLRITRVAAFTWELYLMNRHETLIRTTCELCLSEIWYNQMYDKCKHSSDEAKVNSCVKVFPFGPLLLEEMKHSEKLMVFLLYKGPSMIWCASEDFSRLFEIWMFLTFIPGQSKSRRSSSNDSILTPNTHLRAERDLHLLPLPCEYSTNFLPWPPQGCENC